MNVYEILNEGLGSWVKELITGGAKKTSGYVAKTAAEKMAYEHAVAELSQELIKNYASMEKVEGWKIIEKYAKGHSWEGNTFQNAVTQDAKAIADAYFEKEAGKIGAKEPAKTGNNPPPNGPSTPPARTSGNASKIWSGAWNNKGVIIDGLLAYEFWNATIGSDDSPLNNYLQRMRFAEYKLNIGAGNPDPKFKEDPAYGNSGWSQQQFESYHKEELSILVTRMAAMMIPFGAIGGGMKALKNIATKIPGLNWAAGAPMSLAGRAKQLFYVAWLNYLDTGKVPLPGSGDVISGVPYTEKISTSGKKLTPKEALTWLALIDIPFLPKGTAPVAQAAEWIENGLYFTYNEIAKSVGAAEQVSPANKKPTATQQPSTPVPQIPNNAPAGGGQSNQESNDLPFNPADWKKLPSGYWQDKEGNLMHPDHYNTLKNK